MKHATEKVFECCAVEIPSNNLIIICLYRTPNSNVISFLNTLDTMLHELNRYKKKNIVILGDFNINTLKVDKISNFLQDIAKNYNLMTHINQPTRRLSCIDQILSNIENATASVLPLGLSDHETAQTISFPVVNKGQTQKTTYKYKRVYGRDNIRKFQNSISRLSFSDVYIEHNSDKAFNKFHDLLITIYKLCFPIIKIKMQKHYNKKSWITVGLRKSCKTKRALRIRYYKHKCKKIKGIYLQYSKILKKCIYQAHKNNNNNFINNSRNKCKASWQVIKKEDYNSNYNNNINEIDFNNDIINEPINIATAFNTHFIESSQKLSQSRSNKMCGNKLSKHELGGSMYLMPMAEDEVRKVVLSLNNTNSEGPDEICTKVIKSCINELCSVLTYLINLSFESGNYPQRLKLSVVKPIHKKGSKKDMKNYRPITLVPIIAKIYEKCMFTRLMNYCLALNLINKDQYGFQRHKSTDLAIFALLNEVLTSIDTKKLTTVLFLDMSKAFDLVNHSILLLKLEKLGVRGTPYQWFQSYLSDRQQSVEITNVKEDILETYRSQYMYSRTGVPQGSVLGPLLFILYINDIINITKHRTILFADDVSIIVTTNSKDGLRQHEIDINSTLRDIIEYLDINHLKINLMKTNYMQFNKMKKCNLNLNIEYKGTRIDQADSVKFLGVIIDKDINWKSQIEKICDKINRFVFVLKRLRYVTDHSTVLTAYHAYVASTLRYGLIFWGNSVNVHKAFIAQKKCLRAIYGIPPYQTCKPLFKELNLLTLPSLYIFEISKFVKNNIELFNKASDINPRNTRNPNKLVLNFVPRTTLYMKNCLNMCLKIYNKIPENLKMLNRPLFDKKLYAWLLEKSYYNINELIM